MPPLSSHIRTIFSALHGRAPEIRVPEAAPALVVAPSSRSPSSADANADVLARVQRQRGRHRGAQPADRAAAQLAPPLQQRSQGPARTDATDAPPPPQQPPEASAPASGHSSENEAADHATSGDESLEEVLTPAVRALVHARQAARLQHRLHDAPGARLQAGHSSTSTASSASSASSAAGSPEWMGAPRAPATPAAGDSSDDVLQLPRIAARRRASARPRRSDRGEAPPRYTARAASASSSSGFAPSEGPTRACTSPGPSDPVALRGSTLLLRIGTGAAAVGGLIVAVAAGSALGAAAGLCLVLAAGLLHLLRGPQNAAEELPALRREAEQAHAAWRRAEGRYAGACARAPRGTQVGR
jgi:hypothetical protein